MTRRCCSTSAGFGRGRAQWFRSRFPTRTGNVKQTFRQEPRVSDEGLLVADRRTKAIHRVSLNGAYQSRFTAIDAVRVAVGPQGKLRPSNVTRVRYGSSVLMERRAIFPAAGVGYQLRGPIEVAFDPLGHLYVLERDSVIVFAPTGEFLSLFAPGAVAGAFRMAVAFHVDAAGRLYIYDEDRSCSRCSTDRAAAGTRI